MATVGHLDSGIWDLLGAFQSVSAELARFKDVSRVAKAAAQLAIELTESSVAFVGLVEEDGTPKQVFSCTANPSHVLGSDEVERIVAAAGSRVSTHSADEAMWSGLAERGLRSIRSFCGEPLIAGGKELGVIGVASAAGYTAMQRRAFALFANRVAAALEVAQMNERRQEMLDAMVDLRAELDRSEEMRLVTQERAAAADRVEKAHEAAVAALIAVSEHARSHQDLTRFYAGLTTNIAELVGASKVLFWSVNDDGTLSAIAGAHGIDEAFMARLYPTPCSPDRDDLTSKIVYHDHSFRASRTDESAEYRYVLDALGVQDAISVAWRAGDHRLGLVAAYDSLKPEGFSREDTWVLQKAGLAAGLVWQLRQAETNLQRTVDRLEKVDAARQLLLKNVSTTVDKARRRFADELHDDALQRLTAAELQLQRIRDPDERNAQVLSEVRDLLGRTEAALRRLLFEVRPAALEMPGGFEETIRDRVEILRSITGIEARIDLELPDHLSYEFKSMVFRQVAEALANVEKHASATRVQISVKHVDGAIHGMVVDDGRGFVVSERDHLPGHLGLLALNERSLLAGGWTKINSEPGFGTTVEFWMPCA